MPSRKNPATKFKEPLVILPYRPDERWHTQFCLHEMKKHGATDLAIQCMKNEFDKAAEQTAKARAKRWPK